MIRQLIFELAQPLFLVDNTFCTQVRKGVASSEADYPALLWWARRRMTRKSQAINENERRPGSLALCEGFRRA
jgi:hypothetical protein